MDFVFSLIPSTGVPLFDKATGAVLAAALGLLALMALWFVLVFTVMAIRLAVASPAARPAIMAGYKIKWTWRRACVALGLFERVETTRIVDGKTKTKVEKRVPRIRIKTDHFGVRVRVKTLPNVGREELLKHAQHFADTWGCTRVAVIQDKPGTVIIRAVITDPLTQDHPYVESEPSDVFTWDLGIDEWANNATISLKNIPGITVAGLPGYGKSALVNRGMAQWVKSPLIQMATLDGKGGGDFDDVAPRLFHKGGDSIEECNEFLLKMEDLRKRRSACLRRAFKTKSIWNVPGFGKNGGTGVGFTIEWPLVIAVLDEAHTFFRQAKDGGNRKIKDRNALAAQNAQLVEDLVKKGRSVGILIILPTQKPTSDAMPTAIRDNCPIGMSFAVKTDDAAVAALGADIRKWPDANPVNFQGEDYRLVASLARDDAPGFKRIRASYVPDEHVAMRAQENAELVRNPFELIEKFEEENADELV